jgi:hypothetical protein
MANPLMTGFEMPFPFEIMSTPGILVRDSAKFGVPELLITPDFREGSHCVGQNPEIQQCIRHFW